MTLDLLTANVVKVNERHLTIHLLIGECDLAVSFVGLIGVVVNDKGDLLSCTTGELNDLLRLADD